MNVVLIVISSIGGCFGLLCFMLYCKKKHKKNMTLISISGLYNNLNEILVLQPTYTCPSSPIKTTVIYPIVPQQTVSFPKVPTQLSKVSSTVDLK